MNVLVRPLMTLALLLVAGLAAGLDGETADYRTPRFEVDVSPDIVYGIGLVNREEGGPGTTELKLDAYQPRGNDASDKPVVVLIHGGAYVGGDKRDLSGAAQEFASRGYVCFSIDYRLLGLNPPEGSMAGVVDAQKAVRWVRYHAEKYGIDPGKVAALGHSAGAFIAIGLAFADQDLAAQNEEDFDVFATSTFTSRVNAAVSVAGGFSHGEAIDPMDPPMMILHGTEDPVVPFGDAQKLADACRDNAIPYVLTPLEGFGHDPWNATINGVPFFQFIANFLAAALVEQPVTLRLAVEGEGRILPESIRDSFPRGTLVGLRAEPGVGWAFGAWQGDLQGADAAAVLTMDASKQVQAVFQPLPESVRYTLTVEESPHGAVTLTPPGGAYAPGTIVTLRAEPGQGRQFGYWTGDIRATGAEAAVVMDRDRTVAPGFVVDPNAASFTLEVTSTGPGQVQVVPKQESYVIGTQVLLSAEPEPGAAFVTWESDLGGEEPRMSLTITEAMDVTAVFDRKMTVEPITLAFPQEGARQSVHFDFTPQKEDTSFGYYLDWGGPWFDMTRQKDADELLVSAATNPTPYARLCRIGFFSADARAIHVTGLQPGKNYEPLTVKPGLALYTGLPGEWGTLAWHEPSVSPEDLVLESNLDGTFAVGCYSGTAVGYLADATGEPLRIPDGEDYHIRAAWQLPQNPKGFSSSDNPETERPSYFYIGMDSGGVEFTKIRFGIEWKDIGNGEEWVLRGQRHVKEMSAAGVNGGIAPRHIEVHIWKDPKAKAAESEEGGAAIFAQFRLDQGPWQDYVSEWGTSFVSIGALAYDAGDDVVTFKVRGLGSRHLHDVRVVGPTVPGVNTGLDYDLDGEPNEVDPLPANAEFNSAVDLTDADTNLLIDTWELRLFGESGQEPWGDADRDGVLNYSEMLQGTPPVPSPEETE
jgi:acetyl esterase/lipase